MSAVSHQLTLLNNKQTFEAKPDETILDALLRQGVAVRYGCRRGKCSTCKHYVVEGDYDNSGASSYALLDDEREEGLTLLCQTFAQSDLTIELVEQAADESRVRPATPQSCTGTVAHAVPVGGALWSVRLDLSAPLHPLPGQYIEVAVPGHPGETRPFSVASAPFDVASVEIIVRQLEGGVFSGELGSLARGTELAVSGPYGQMILRPSPRPAVLLGDCTGISPMLSMVRYSGECGWAPGMRVVQVCANENELVSDEMAAWASLDSGFSYTVFERLADAVAQSISGEDVDMYVAGDPAFCDQATFLLEARGVSSSHIYVERFYPAE